MFIYAIYLYAIYFHIFNTFVYILKYVHKHIDLYLYIQIYLFIHLFIYGLKNAQSVCFRPNTSHNSHFISHHKRSFHAKVEFYFRGVELIEHSIKTFSKLSQKIFEIFSKKKFYFICLYSFSLLDDNCDKIFFKKRDFL